VRGGASGRWSGSGSGHGSGMGSRRVVAWMVVFTRCSGSGRDSGGKGMRRQSRNGRGMGVVVVVG